MSFELRHILGHFSDPGSRRTGQRKTKRGQTADKDRDHEPDYRCLRRRNGLTATVSSGRPPRRLDVKARAEVLG